MAEILNFVNRVDIKSTPEGINRHEGNIRRIKTQPESKSNIIKKVSELPIHFGFDVNKIMASISNKKVSPIISKDQNKTCLGKEEGHKINLTSKMIDETIRSRDSVCSIDGFETRTYNYTEPKSKENVDVNKEETENNDNINDNIEETIKNALHIFENTNNLTEEENDQKETPAFMQVSGEIKNKDTKEEPSETYEENQLEFGTTHTAEIGKNFGVPSHESSGYLDGMNAFKAQMGTDKYETTPEPQVSRYEEQPMRNFAIHTNENPVNVNSGEIEENSDLSNIDAFVKQHVPLGDFKLNELTMKKKNCVDYVQHARTTKMKAGQEIDNLDAQMDEKDARIAKLQAQMDLLIQEKNELNNSKQSWQDVYSKANIEESLGTSKIDEINKFVYNELNSLNQMDNNSSSYSNVYTSQGYAGGMEDSGYSRGRRAA